MVACPLSQGDKNLKEPEHGWCNYLATPLKAKFNNIYGDLQWLQYSRWMQLGFPLDSRQDKKYSLMNSINCTQPRSIGPSSAQSPSLSVMLPAGESRTHPSKDGEGKTSILHSEDFLFYCRKMTDIVLSSWITHLFLSYIHTWLKHCPCISSTF